MRCGLDNYGLFPLKLSPLEELEWARKHGAEGVQFSGVSPEFRMDDAALKDLAQYARDHGMYLEWGGGQHIPLDMETRKEIDIFEVNREAARKASILGTRIVRSCSGGLMRWNPKNPDTDTLIELSADSLKLHRNMLQDYGVVLAIETHFEFTSFELLRLFEMCGADPGGSLGICLDTMNLLTMLEEPVSAARRLLPWVVSTHIKDGGILAGKDGLISFPAALGKGSIHLPAIINLLSALSEPVNLSVEDHGGHFPIPVFDRDFLARFPDLSRDEFTGLIEMSDLTQSKLEAGELAITPRKEWPSVCEERLAYDLKALKEMAG